MSTQPSGKKRITRKRLAYVNFGLTSTKLGHGYFNPKVVRVQKANGKNALLVTLQVQKLVAL